MEPQVQEKKNNWVMWVAIVVAILAIVYGVMAYFKKEDTTLTGTPNTSNNGKQDVVSSIYKDGVYTATGSYTSPGGPEQVGVTLTIKNDVVTDATVEKLATRPNSVTFQNIFANNFKSLVVGKKVDEVNLDTVSGSSLTPIGWNDAVAKIKVQAKS